jgi:hypothetical protein
MVAVPLSGSPL